MTWWFFGKKQDNRGREVELNAAEKVEAERISNSKDAIGKEALRQWPNRTRQWPLAVADGYWLKCRPFKGHATPPILEIDGLSRKTIPDGLWIHFVSLDTVHVIAIEVCSTWQNMQSKLGSFPSVNTVSVDGKWFFEEIRTQRGGARPVYSAIGSFDEDALDGLRKVGKHRLRIERLSVGIAVPDDCFEDAREIQNARNYTFLRMHDLDDHQSMRVRAIANLSL